MANRRRLTDEQIAELRRLRRDEGLPLAELAKRFGVAISTVSRLTRNERRAALEEGAASAPGRMSQAVEAFLAASELPAERRALGEALRFLAARMDAAATSDAVGALQASASLSREFVGLLHTLTVGDDEAVEEARRSLAWLMRGGNGG